jgi:hypothetical protein
MISESSNPRPEPIHNWVPANPSECHGSTNSNCFELCSCACGVEGGRFDQIVASETYFGLTMRELAHSNIGWFVGYPDPCFNDWRMSNEQGVYLLWEKDDYCLIHEQYHCKALYVGKGAVKARIWEHSRTKRFSEDEVTYFTFVFMDNRKAKYIEQVVLDLFDLPLNKAENSGKDRLCSYLDQGEVDFGS